MKANQKFLNNDDEAVSPVIAVILMVAITVVLAATVYVWVSGFGASGAQAKNLSVTQGTATIPGGTAASSAPFTIVSISSNFGCSNLKATSSGSGGPWLYSTAAGAGAFSMTFNGAACTTQTLGAGDIVTLVGGAATAGPVAGNTINFIDTASNTVVASVTLH